MHTAFQQGRAARIAGRALEDNPHQRHDQEWNDWHDGWTSKPSPAYLVRDNCLGTVLASSLTRREAGALATKLTTQTPPDQPVATSSGLDRFTVGNDFS